MTRIPAILLSVLVLVGASGCMVADELDKAAALMPDSTKKGKVEEEVAGPDAAAARADALLRESKQWWDRATSIAPGQLESSIVSCRIAGATQFMSRDDCLSQGGVPGRTSS